MKKQRIKIKFIIACLFLVIAVLLSLCLGSAKISLSELGEVLQAGRHSVTTSAGKIFWYARLPRTVACVLAGTALAVSGAVIQGVLTNQLASPSIIGVNAGAGFAVTICCALGLFSGWMIAGEAFVGAVCTVLVVA